LLALLFVAVAVAILDWSSSSSSSLSLLLPPLRAPRCVLAHAKLPRSS
jgi:hypothetical protein